jgi:plastocyanin
VTRPRPLILALCVLALVGGLCAGVLAGRAPAARAAQVLLATAVNAKAKRCGIGNDRTARRCRCLKHATSAKARARCRKPVKPAPKKTEATGPVTLPDGMTVPAPDGGAGPAPARTDAAAPTTTTTAAATSTEPPAAPTTWTVGVTLREFSVTLSRVRIGPGQVRLDVANFGQDPHDLHVRRDDTGADVAASPLVDPSSGGRPGTVTVRTQLQIGAHTLYCALPGHEQAGMHAQLLVAAQGTTGR